MTLRILRAGLDTLEVSFDGSLDFFKRAPLDALKLKAQELNEGLPYSLGNKEFCFSPKGLGPFAYLFSSRDFDLRVSRSFDEKMPNASVRLNAYGLATINAEQMLNHAALCLQDLGDFREHGLSRMDYAVDYQLWVPTYDEMRSVVCKSRYRPVFPNIENPETFYFGQGDKMLRVYDKSRQAVARNKPFWFAVFDECESYDHTLPVWRCECQVRRQLLRELGVATSESLFRNGPEAVFDWVMHWAELRVPNGDKKTTRWPVDPRWEELRSVASESKTLMRARHVSRLLEAEKLAGRVVGLAATLGAHENVRDFDEAVRRQFRLVRCIWSTRDSCSMRKWTSGSCGSATDKGELRCRSARSMPA